MDDRKPIAIIAVAMVALLAGGAWWFSRDTKAPPAAANASPAAAVTATEAVVPKTEALPLKLPPMDEMDAFLRPLLAALSSRPELADWLATDDLIGQIASAIDQAAAGSSPARDFKVVKPAGPFDTSGRGNQRFIDPSSYRRYDSLVQTVTSIDATRVAVLYKTIRPRLNEAYRRMGNPDGDVDRAMARVLDILLDTPIVKDPIPVVSDEGAWVFADEELEARPPTQKQLLRMGSANVDRVLVWLRALQAALE
jgi:hypothetical protein